MILVVGSINIDTAIQLPHFPRRGETTLGVSHPPSLGGKGANQAAASARYGAPTTLVGRVGRDLKERQIHDSALPPLLRLQLTFDPHAATGRAHVYLSDAGENHIVVLPGANHQLSTADLPDLSGVTHLLLQLESPASTVHALAQTAHSQGVTVVLNASPVTELTPEFLRTVDILMVNEGEARALARAPADTDLHQVAAALGRDGPSVVITRGRHGSLALHHDLLIETSGHAVDAVSTVGAGDAFTGTLVAALSLGTPWPEALSHANAAGALTCTRPGALEAQPARPEIIAFLQREGDTNEKVHY